jgi:phosphoglycolate phosphatase
MKTLIALYGYLGAEDAPEGWNADGLITHPMEVLRWLSRSLVLVRSAGEARY